MGSKYNKMTTDTIISIVSAFISLVAVVVSFFSGRKTRQLDLKLKQMELASKKQESEESKKASVEVNVVETAPKQANKLRFYNKGKAIARDIRFSIPTDDEANGIQLHMSNDYLPYPQLLPQQSFDIPYHDFSNLPHQTIVITWEDDFSKDRKVEMVVDM